MSHQSLNKNHYITYYLQYSKLFWTTELDSHQAYQVLQTRTYATRPSVEHSQREVWRSGEDSNLRAAVSDEPPP